MAFNKSKALESALKYLNQGKVAQAIGEYQEILRRDAKDQATLMTVGDLFARQGDMPQAIEYFERLAQVYLNDGFNSKAIAIYKKIAKLAPNELAPLERLADLYVQQGVLSEARPLFLQIAEAHLKANRAPKAVEVLNRLLEVEPENPRVQMRLAELYNVMGQKKEAAQTYLGYAQRLFERGDTDEAPKLIERALEVDPSNAAARLLKAKILAAAGKSNEAIAILEKHPEADAGAEVTNLLVDLELKSGHTDKAADRARNQLVRGSAHFGLLGRVADSLVEAGKAHEALPLLRELRDPMIEAGEQDKFLKSLSDVAEKLPSEVEPFEMLADFSRHTSDPFQLSSALTKLVDLYAADGNYSRAEELMQELIERNKGDERLVARLDQLRRREQGAPAPAEIPEPVATAEATSEEPRVPERFAAEPASAEAEAAPAVAPPIVEEPLDEETQRYISQALTDVDLFSSYGLTQKATHLLENVLQRAPRHTPTLERLLDLYLGAGDERRTAELAAELEQIHRERQDTVNADRFAELRRRFSKAADLTEEKLTAEPAATGAAATVPQAPVEAESAGAIPVDAAPAPAAAAEFEIPLPTVEPETPPVEEPQAAVAPAGAQSVSAELEPVAAGDEVDLSDEWEAMVQEVAEPEATTTPQAAQPAAEPALAEDERIEIEVPAEPEPVEIQEAAAEPASEPVLEIVEEAAQEAPAAATSGEFELELAAEPSGIQGKAGAVTSDDFLSELAAEVEGLEAPAAAAPEGPVATGGVTGASSGPAPQGTAETLNELAEVFQEFRTELGELGGEEEDLETHYNLGIAYREMGLLDEAIGEFQKVAQAVQKGKPFPYAMNCSTLLALSFLDKGEPKIASLWYQRALETPGLDQEAVLALRYDLGVSLDLAGEASAALDSFRQVYAMNIDYRDVADRIATLQKT
ncbi:MAG: tetratricopeptide repeat protein [Candidatus Acidiferrales bacterium]|jgi:tetratricopeptide (TPR) repeat protein